MNLDGRHSRRRRAVSTDSLGKETALNGLEQPPNKSCIQTSSCAPRRTSSCSLDEVFVWIKIVFLPVKLCKNVRKKVKITDWTPPHPEFLIVFVQKRDKKMPKRSNSNPGKPEPTAKIKPNEKLSLFPEIRGFMETTCRCRPTILEGEGETSPSRRSARRKIEETQEPRSELVQAMHTRTHARTW